MAKKKRKRDQAEKSTSDSAKLETAPPRIMPGMYVLGAFFLVVCGVTSLMLVLEHLGGLSLPGCGEGSPCAKVTSGPWGRVPGIGWPVSFVGLAYFFAALVTWASLRNGVPRGFRYLVRLGALLSLGFVALMAMQGEICSYCVATHLANFAFWITMECTRSSTRGSTRSLAGVLGGFVVASLILGAIEWGTQKEVTARAEENLAESTEEIIAESARKAAEAAIERGPDADPEQGPAVAQDPDGRKPSGGHPEPSEGPVPGTNGGAPATAGATTDPAATGDVPNARNFTGRYRTGPERAALRMVIISDYQCRECARIEKIVRGVLQATPNMSLSAKHFPVCTDCNSNTRSNMHPNACWAARAAEAAGILGGNDGFWKMHHWLFDKGGGFTREELQQALREFGFDIPEFERLMMGDRTLQLVKQDIAEAVELGLYQTPMIFINGVELRGWEAPNAIPRAVQQLLAADPPPMTAANDAPPGALDKLVGDWRFARRVILPQTPDYRVRGPKDSASRIVIFGDLTQEGTVKTDALVRETLENYPNMRYEFRHYPFDQTCNPTVKQSLYANACRATRAAESAGRLGGHDAYWRMHDWLLANQAAFNEAGITDDQLRAQALAIGLDPDALLATMASPEIEQAIAHDARIAKRFGLRGVPAVFVNGQMIFRWEAKGANVLPRVIAEAAGDADGGANE